MSYDSDTRHRFALYRGGLAIVNPSSVSVFSATGRRTLRQTSDFSSPFAIASDQYVLVYDTSGTTFSLYNSFAKVHSEHFDYPVTDACFAGDRTFAVVSRTDRSKSVVYAYDRNFKFKGSVPYSYYIFDIALDSDNGRMMSAGYDNGSGTGKTMVEIREYPFVKEENATLSHTIEIEGEFPLGCGFLDEKRIAVVTTAGIYIYDQNAELLTSERYVGKTVLGFDISSHGVSVVTVYASQNEAIAFDAAGRMVYHDSILLNADEVGQFDGYLFLKAQNQVLRIELSTGQEKRLQSSDGQMLVYDQKNVLVCGEAKAAYLIF